MRASFEHDQVLILIAQLDYRALLPLLHPRDASESVGKSRATLPHWPCRVVQKIRYYHQFGRIVE